MLDITLRNPEFLWLLVAVPAVAGCLWLRRHRRPALRFPMAESLAKAPRGLRTRLLWVPPALLMLSILLLSVALARPQLPAELGEREAKFEGIDVAIALDLSSSMQANDLAPSRMDVARDVLSSFLDSRVNDRVSLVVFSGAAYTQAPLTIDYAALKNVVAQLRAGTLEDGTAIGDALATALNRLRESTAKSRALVLITDGDNNAGRLSPEDAAVIARELGIPVFPILVGKGGVASMPVGRSPSGEVVYDRVEAPVNARLLEEIAAETGGQFYRATDRDGLGRGLSGALAKMERSPLTDGGASAPPRELFGGLLGAALVLAAFDALLRSTLLRVSP